MQLRAAGFGIAVVALSAALMACQSPNDPDETVDTDDFVEASVTPNPVTAGASDGRTYRVVRGNNQPDEIIPYSYKASFTLRVNLNDKIDDGNFDPDFPITLSSASVKVQQASGGIVTPPTGGDVEHYEAAPNASSNQFPAVNSPVNIGFDVWYDLPNKRKEALVSITLSFVDSSNQAFTKVANVQIAP